MSMLNVLSANPAEIYYEDRGEGAPVVLIHGWPLSGRSWESQVQPLIDSGHRVITYDRRGFGSSSQAAGGYDYDTLADDLDALMRHLDLRDATLVGFSMGGGEVVRYLARYGDERVSHAVLASSVTPYLFAADDNPEGAIDQATVDSFLHGVASDRPQFLDGFFDMFFAPGGKGKLGVSDQQKAYAMQIALFASPHATAKCIEAFAYTDFREDLAAIDVPTLVIHGDSDAIVPFEASGKRTAEMIADTQLLVIEGGPHAINATHAEHFNAALIAFMHDELAANGLQVGSMTHIK